MENDRRLRAKMMRPLGAKKGARLRHEWTALEAVAWIASSDLDLVSGVSAYQPLASVIDAGLEGGARMSALRMDIEDGFCCCGGQAERIKVEAGLGCTCFARATDSLLKATRSGGITGYVSGKAMSRSDFKLSMLKDDPMPLFRQEDIRRLWKATRKFRNKELSAPDVTLPELAEFARSLGPVGQRRTMEAAVSHFSPRRVKDALVREGCRTAFPDRKSGRPARAN